MAFSTIEITFTSDYVDNDKIAFVYNQGAGGVEIQYFCVTSGATGREFDLPTPTGTAGEATAAAYESAFNLFDVPLGLFTISRSVNVVTITATEINILITGFKIETGKGSAVITNTTFVEKINVRSPYFINTPTDAGNILPLSSELELRVWTGDKTTDRPPNPTYTLQAQATNVGDDNIYFEVSELIRDFIIQSFNGQHTSIAAWMEYDITTTYDTGTLNAVKTLICLDGYTDFKNGVNYIGETVNGYIEDAVLFDNREIYALKDSKIVLPVYRNSTSTVGFYLNNVLQDTESFVGTNLTSEIIAYSEYDLTDGDIDEIRITNTNTGTITSVAVIIVEECKYTPTVVSFVNKYGAIQDLTMFKARKENLRVSKEKYKGNLVTTSNGLVQYNNTEHNIKNYLVKGNKTIQLNSGYLSEDNNVIFEQLFLSERVWGDIDNVINPLNVESSSLPIKTRINDKLISYTIDFSYSYDQVNNVR